MAAPTHTNQPTVTTEKANASANALATATDERNLQRFISLRDSTDPFEAEAAMRLAGELIDRYMPLVGAAVNRWRAKMPKATTIVDSDDLRSTGAEGLWNALLEFDPQRGTPFVNFACRHIGWAMSAEVRRGDFLKRDIRREVQRSWRAVSALENRLGRTATDSEAAEASGVSVARYRDLCKWDQRGLTAELTDPLINYLSGSSGSDSSGSDPLERLCAVEEALDEMPTEDGEIAASVREIGQAVENIKGYFDMEGAA